MIEFKKRYIAIYSTKLVEFFGWLTHGKPKEGQMAALFPFIFFRKKNQVPEDGYQIRHELIHFRQQVETLFIGLEIIKQIEIFYAYFFLHKNKFERYMYSACEQEAYLNQNNPNYLKERKLFAMFKYIKNKKNFRNNKDTGEITYQ